MDTSNDDNLQGILFHQQNIVDLRSYSRRQRMIRVMTKTRRQLHQRINLHQASKAIAATGEAKHDFAFTVKNSKSSDLAAFNQRFKHTLN